MVKFLKGIRKVFESSWRLVENTKLELGYKNSCMNNGLIFSIQAQGESLGVHGYKYPSFYI